MLSSLFKKGWQSDSAQTRLSAIQKLNLSAESSQQIFEELANTDPDINVRHVAIDKSNNAKLLFNISELHDITETKYHARKAFSKLIGVNGEFSEEQLTELSITLPKAIPTIIQHGRHSQLRTDLANKLSELELAELLGEVEFNDTRVLIAEKLTLIDALELARKGLLGKDKTAEKLVKEKIDEIHAQQKLDKENSDNALLLCEKMEYIAQHLDVDDWRPEFSGQFSIWSQRWTDMNYSPNETIKQRYTAAYEKVSNAVAEMNEINDAKNAQQQICDAVVSKCQHVAGLSLSGLSEQQASLSEELTNIQSEWDIKNSIITPTSEINSRFKQAMQSVKSALVFCQSVSENDSEDALVEDILKDALAKLDWQMTSLALVSQLEMQAKFDDLKQQGAEKKLAEKDKLDKLHKRINRLLGVTQKGNLAQAKRELAAITKAIEHYSGKDRSVLDERLEKANVVVGKMLDWNNFVTEPKYLELCEAMEALVGVKANPDKLAKKIHSLQEQWKNLGYSDSSETHWERFKKAADKAYKPCDTFFKERQTKRQQNLAKREPYLAEMKALWEQTDWDESPDYKSIENAIRRIMQDWQKIKDVEHRAGQKQWKKLNKIKDAINEKLSVVYDTNIELKNKIITQTSALLETDVSDQTLSKLQLFQSRWKQVGITRRNQDQAAWKRFKNTSDEVYAKIQGLRKEARDEEDAQINQYRDVIKQIQTLAKESEDIASGDKELIQLQESYTALPDLPDKLPEKLTKGLATDYRRACELYNKTHDRLVAQERSKVIDMLSQKARLCTELEQLGSSPEEAKIASLKSAINDVHIEEKAISKQFDKRLSNANNCDHQEAAQRRKRMCIDLEILLGVESPFEDKALRMEMQLESLKDKGLGQGLSFDVESVRQLNIDWLCLPSADFEVQQNLDKRFYKLSKKVK